MNNVQEVGNDSSCIIQWEKLKVKFSRYRPGVAQRVGTGVVSTLT